MTESKTLVPPATEDYQTILEELNIPFIEDDHYLRIGTPRISQGWILHLSVVLSQAVEFIHEVLPLINKYSAPIKIIKNRTLHRRLNEGSLGFFKTGKVVTIFLDNPSLSPGINAYENIQGLLNTTANISYPLLNYCIPSLPSFSRPMGH